MDVVWQVVGVLFYGGMVVWVLYTSLRDEVRYRRASSERGFRERAYGKSDHER